MVSINNPMRDVVLYRAGRQLLLDVADWAGRHGRFPLRLVSSSRPVDIRESLSLSAFAVIDATTSPAEALRVLQTIVEMGAGERVALYTESMHPGLELAVRLAGVPVLLGPLGPNEWEGVFESLVARVVA